MIDRHKTILVEGQIFDLIYVYQFIKRLVTPFNKTKAFDLGIINDKGEVLKKRADLSAQDEKNAYTYFDTVIFNLKKMLGMLPFGKTMLASFAAALLLLKEEKNFEFHILQEYDNKILEEKYYAMLSNIKNNPSTRESLNLLQFTLLEEREVEEDMTTSDLPTLKEPIATKSAVERYKKRMKKDSSLREDDLSDQIESHGNYKVFIVDNATFMGARVGKTRYERYNKYVGGSAIGDHIRNYAIKNPKKPIILKDEKSGQLCFLKYGSEALNTLNRYYGK